jgi:hypothetical protein
VALQLIGLTIAVAFPGLVTDTITFFRSFW